jgi:hypothetical protein
MADVLFDGGVNVIGISNIDRHDHAGFWSAQRLYLGLAEKTPSRRFASPPLKFASCTHKNGLSP